MIGILLKMLVSDRGGAAAAADDVNDGGLSYSDDDNNVDDKDGVEENCGGYPVIDLCCLH